MAQTGFTPIQIYHSTTPTNTPSAGDLVDGELAINTADGKLFYKDSGGSVQTIATTAGANGDVVGPASATDNAIVRFDGTTGKLVQNSAATIDDTTGDITAGAYNKVTITAPATGSTLTIADGKTLTANSSLTLAGVDAKTLTVNNSLTLAGTDATTMTFPATSATIARTDAAQTFTGTQTFSGAVSVQGNTTLGDASTDTVTVNGYMGVGITPSANVGVFTRPSALTTTSQYGVLGGVLANASATTLAVGVMGEGRTAATAFTVADLAALYANNSTRGAGSTITNQHGIYISDQTQGTNNYGITSLVSSGSNKWNIYASGTAANYFAGNVGIGTSSPNNTLQVNTPVVGVSTPVRVSNSSATTNGRGAGIEFFGGSNTFGRIEGFWAGTDEQVRLFSTGSMTFASGGTTERLRLSTTEAVFNDPGNDYDFRVESDTNTHALFVQGSDGNVGIGTSSPTAKAQITKAALTGFVSRTQATLTLENSGDTELYFASGNANVGQLRFGDDGGNFRGAISYDHFSDGFLFYTAGTERLRIDSSGNLGLGVTPSAWGAAFRAFDLYGAGLASSTTGGQSVFAQNGFNNGTNYIYKYTAAASAYQQLLGQHIWSTAPSGTAGNAITFTERASIGATEFVVNNPGEDYDFRVESDTNTHALFVQGSDGNVGIGSSAPDAQLHVYNPSGTTGFYVTRSTTIAGGVSVGLSCDSAGARQYVYGDGLKFWMAATGGVAAEKARLTVDSNLKIGGTADRATTVGTKHLDIFDGTAPVGTLANGISIYSSSGEAYVMDAAGNATLFSPHDAETNEWIFKSKHTPTGKVLRIDVEKLLRFVNDHFGLDAVQEFIEP